MRTCNSIKHLIGEKSREPNAIRHRGLSLFIKPRWRRRSFRRLRQYLPQRDLLTGVYDQVVVKQKFEVLLVRSKS